MQLKLEYHSLCFSKNCGNVDGMKLVFFREKSKKERKKERKKETTSTNIKIERQGSKLILSTIKCNVLCIKDLFIGFLTVVYGKRPMWPTKTEEDFTTEHSSTVIYSFL